ncbi:MAG: hypothetical protein IJZ76_08340 [Lachnospiraceae bacterium]|nr:hypothetical protein [Lachnospiraceae bacterium]
MDEITVVFEIMIVSTVKMRNDYGLCSDLVIHNRNNSEHVTVAVVVSLERNVKHL